MSTEYRCTELLSLAKKGNVKKLKTAIHKSVREGGPGWDVTNKRKQKLIHAAIEGQHYEMVKFVLRKTQVDINEKDETGWTALHAACYEGDPRIVKLILDVTGVDVDAKSVDDQLPLHYFVRSKAEKNKLYFDTLDRLLGPQSKNVNSKNSNGDTPLHTAAGQRTEGAEEVVRSLVRRSAKVNLRNNFGETPLHCAVRSGNKTSVNVILAKGANLHLKSAKPLLCDSTDADEADACMRPKAFPYSDEILCLILSRSIHESLYTFHCELYSSRELQFRIFDILEHKSIASKSADAYKPVGSALLRCVMSAPTPSPFLSRSHTRHLSRSRVGSGGHFPHGADQSGGRPLIKYAIEKEIERLTDAELLLREESLTVAILSDLCCNLMKRSPPNTESGNFFQLALEPILSANEKFCKNLEVSPQKLFGGSTSRDSQSLNDILHEHQENLLDITRRVLKSVISAESALPGAVRLVCKYLYQLADEKFPGYGYKALGGFLFLRCLCPALVSPETLGLSDSPPLGSSVRRGRVLVAKLLQNLANEATFEKEEYMQAFNEFIENSAVSVGLFFNKILNGDVSYSSTSLLSGFHGDIEDDLFILSEFLEGIPEEDSSDSERESDAEIPKVISKISRYADVLRTLLFSNQSKSKLSPKKPKDNGYKSGSSEEDTPDVLSSPSKSPRGPFSLMSLPALSPTSKTGSASASITSPRSPPHSPHAPTTPRECLQEARNSWRREIREKERQKLTASDGSLSRSASSGSGFDEKTPAMSTGPPVPPPSTVHRKSLPIIERRDKTKIERENSLKNLPADGDSESEGEN